MPERFSKKELRASRQRIERRDIRLAAVEQEIRDEETEACAKIAEGFVTKNSTGDREIVGSNEACELIAERIRDRIKARQNPVSNKEVARE